MALNSVPQAGQTLQTTRDPIRTNFNVIATAFVQDHVDYNTTGQGKHNKVTFPSQSVSPAFVATELGLYNAVDVTTGVNELFVKKAAGTGIPFTAWGNPSGQNGWTMLPSGVLIKFGLIAGGVNPNNTLNINLSGIGPAFSAVYNAQVTCQGASYSGQIVVVTSLNTGILQIQSNSNGNKYWQVIGRI